MLNRLIKSVFVVVVVSIAISGCRDDSVSQPSLHEAAKRNDIALVKSLLDSGADVNARNGNEETPLHIAASFGHREFVEILLASGADVGAEDEDGDTALEAVRAAARTAGRAEVVGLLEGAE